MSVARINDIIEGWKTWRYLAAASADTTPTSFPASQYDTDLAAGRVIVVKPYTHVILRAFGVGSDTNTVTVDIAGWMTPAQGNRATGVGPGFRFPAQTATLRTHALTVPPITDKNWATSTTYRECTWAAATSGVSAIVTSNTVYGQIVLNTLGYARLSIYFETFTGATAIGVLYRPFSYASTGASA